MPRTVEQVKGPVAKVVVCWEAPYLEGPRSIECDLAEVAVSVRVAFLLTEVSFWAIGKAEMGAAHA